MRVTIEDCFEDEPQPTMEQFAAYLSADLIAKGGMDAGEDITEFLLNVSITYDNWVENAEAPAKTLAEAEQQLSDDYYEREQARRLTA